MDKVEFDKRIFNESVKLNHAEKALISQKMALENCKNLSAFLRNSALNRTHKVRQKDTNAIELISQIKYLGNNLNQIAIALNIIKKSADKSVYSFDFVEEKLAQCVKYIEEKSSEAFKETE